jgi:hypothetical protein
MLLIEAPYSQPENWRDNTILSSIKSLKPCESFVFLSILGSAQAEASIDWVADTTAKTGYPFSDPTSPQGLRKALLETTT